MCKLLIINKKHALEKDVNGYAMKHQLNLK